MLWFTHTLCRKAHCSSRVTHSVLYYCFHALKGVLPKTGNHVTLKSSLTSFIHSVLWNEGFIFQVQSGTFADFNCNRSVQKMTEPMAAIAKRRDDVAGILCRQKRAENRPSKPPQRRMSLIATEGSAGRGPDQNGAGGRSGTDSRFLRSCGVMLPPPDGPAIWDPRASPPLGEDRPGGLRRETTWPR